LPYVWPGAGLPRPAAAPAALDARLGHWAFDAGTPITSGTWDAAWWSARAALAGARTVLGNERGAFSLCRPPGHHATPDAFGGYCYLGNSAIAAQAMRDGGAARVAVLDVDYHHGNGTQATFWDRPDVLTVSLHADPLQEYPYFTGHADERGGGAGEGANRNLPMPWGTGFDRWSEALDVGCGQVEAFGADALVVPLGVDTHEDDPISRFRLRSDDYLRVGARIARLELPTLFVLEGGYATDVIGVNVANVLEGFED
jgi:acetoin utilization deacetylase AcuC-like enzyme